MNGVLRSPRPSDEAGKRHTAAGSTQPRVRSAYRGRVTVLVADGHPLYQEAFEAAVRNWPEMKCVPDEVPEEVLLALERFPDIRAALERLMSAWPRLELVRAPDNDALIANVQRLRPRVLVVDPKTTGVGCTDLLNAAPEPTRLLVVTSDPQPAEVYAALTAGVAGFMAKDCAGRELCDAVMTVGRGEEVVGTSVLKALTREMRLRGSAGREFLSDREREVLALAGEGLSAPQIAQKLQIRTTTVKTHLSRIYEVLSAHDRAHAVKIAMQRGWIE